MSVNDPAFSARPPISRTTLVYTIRPLLPGTEVSSVHRLWQESLGSRWPLSPSFLARSLGLDGGEGECNDIRLGAFADQRLIGVGSAEITGESEAALLLVAVAPNCQLQGVGAGLLRALRLIFDAKGIRTVTLGAGASRPLWHGVPVSLPGALAFFQRHADGLDEVSYDLIRGLADLRAPTIPLQRARHYGVSIETLSSEFTAPLLTFEEDHFPDWRPYFFAAIADGELHNVLIARRRQEIVGSTLLSEAPDCPGAQWEQRLGPRLGAFGVIGVTPRHRGHGVGAALVADAMWRLRNRGVLTCFVHWTDLRDWYVRLGFQVWEEYRLGNLHLINR